MALSPGTRLGPYEIVELLGKGGMGEVYRARDPRLDRDLAIKVLPSEALVDADRLRRFEQEARAASALNHPSIVTIYDVGREDGLPYIAMEYVPGRGLDELIATGLSADDLLRYATEIAEGMARAHEAGIVHRDLKPGNLLVGHDGRVKILDFGLAKLRPPEAASEAETLEARATSPGMVLGTSGYMSPEQARGEELDFRSDLFSFGAVLYEMATQKPAFRRGNAAETLGAVLTEDPAPIGRLRPQLPAELGTLIERCLAKRRQERFASTGELLERLRRLASASLRERRDARPFLAVLPFTNLSADPDNEYFGHGLTEEVISDLSRVKAVRVISSRSAMLFDKSDKDSVTIGRELGVDYLLDGTVRKAGEAIRITAQLAETSRGSILWTEKYGGSTADIFAIQEELSRRIVEGLRIQLAPEDLARLSERPMRNLRAYECYQKARHEIWRFTEESLERAQRLIESALEMVGDDPLLFHAMGMVHVQLVHAGIRRDKTHLETARHWAEKLFAVAPDSASGHALEAFIDYKAGRLRRAARSARRALAIEPDHPEALFWHIVHAPLGQTERARFIAQKALELDPLNVMTHWAIGFIERLEGRFAEAVAAAERTLRLDPDHVIAVWDAAFTRLCNGEHDHALSHFARLQTGAYSSLWRQAAHFMECCITGRRGEAVQTLSPEWTEFMWEDEYNALNVAEGLAMIGEHDLALDWLEQATGPREFIHYPFLSEIDPLLAPLRGEPRFEQIMNRVESEWRALSRELRAGDDASAS